MFFTVNLKHSVAQSSFHTERTMAYCWLPPQIPNLPKKLVIRKVDEESILIDAYLHWKQDRPYSRHFFRKQSSYHVCLRTDWVLSHLPFSIQIPWWDVFEALDNWKTMFTRDVAWATCQCIPVPAVVSGMLIEWMFSAAHCLQILGYTYRWVLITKFLTERKLDVDIEPQKKQIVGPRKQQLQVICWIIPLSTVTARYIWIRVCMIGMNE